MKINKEFYLPNNVGSNQQAYNKMIIAHSTATPNASARAIARNMYNGAKNNGAYVHYVVDDKEIFQVGEIGFKAWGCGEPGNTYGYVQIELCEFTDKTRAINAYKNYINLIVSCCDIYKISRTLDDNSMQGVKTHKWVSRNLGGTDHTDPYGYLLTLGVSRETFKEDLNTIYKPDVVVVNFVPGYGVNSYDQKGNPNLGTNKKLIDNTCWKSLGVYSINNEPMYKIGNNEFLPQKYTQFKNYIQINYAKGYGVNAYDRNFKMIKDSNRKFKTGTRWKFSGIHVHNYQVFYLVSNTEYILSKYTCGGGFGGV